VTQRQSFFVPWRYIKIVILWSMMIDYAEDRRCVLSRCRRASPGGELASRPNENERTGMGALPGARRNAGPNLRDGIYELRAKQGHVQYRILYFFHQRQVAILARSLTKEDTIPAVDIERAIMRKKLFESNPRKHTYEGQS
jgi:hypothetical protein